ncbi:MAG: Gfo/Idh/MocA family oxidoreductase [Planctomycetota bacterium]|nr:Gfo/Idh/MocA family oxidoreductase [Planctomycetota bacterium]MDA1138548.1 Gfo/Idh/MocA family oxidoreductase [Planctomycetota bacterium]
MNNLKVVTIGAWGHLGTPIQAMNSMDNVKLVALAKAHAEEDPSFLRKHASAADDSQIFDDHRAMLSAIKPDVAIISTRLDLLTDCILDALNAGVHVIAEKPLVPNRKRFEELKAAINANDVFCISTMSNNCGQPTLQAIRALVDDGTIGKVVMVNARKSYPWNDERAWRFTKANGGIMGWVGVHAMSFIMAATGESFTSAVAMESNQINPDEWSDCPDHAGVVLGLTGGGHATISMDYFRPKGASSHGDDWIRLVGTKAVAEASISRNTLQVTTAESDHVNVALPEWTPVFENFFNELLAEKRGPVGKKLQEDILTMTETCLCAQEAADSGKVVRVSS